jgi:predicted RNase H-like nuclease (RuvC/YqgF family)
VKLPVMTAKEKRRKESVGKLVEEIQDLDVFADRDTIGTLEDDISSVGCDVEDLQSRVEEMNERILELAVRLGEVESRKARN